MHEANCTRSNVTIGTFTTAEPIEHTRNNYETASWWRKYATDTGTFDVKLGQNYYDGKDPVAYVEFPATVVDEYFPSSWCGVPIGKTVKGDDVPGRRECLTLGLTLIRAISDSRFRVRHEFYPRAIAHSTGRLDWWVKCLAEQWAQENGPEKNDYQASLSMVAHYSQLVRDEARLLETAKRGLESYEHWVLVLGKADVAWILTEATEAEIVDRYRATYTPYGVGYKAANCIHNAAAWRGIEGVCWKARGTHHEASV